jgi:hypothetical protein
VDFAEEKVVEADQTGGLLPAAACAELDLTNLSPLLHLCYD